MLDFKGKDDAAFWDALGAAGHWAHELDGAWQYSDEAAIQAFIDTYQPPMPDLSPRQFRYLLAVTGLVPVVEQALAYLQVNNPTAYADVYCQLTGGLTFFWVKSLAMYNQLYPLFTQFNPDLTLDEDALRTVWLLSKAY